jgi:aconitate hydratase
MIRGTFANIRLRNHLAPDTEGGFTRDFTRADTPVTTIYETAESYERIHRSNLIGMGVLPLQFPDGQNAETLGLSGEETFTINGLADTEATAHELRVAATDPQGQTRTFAAIVRIDTPAEAGYYRHGGILPYVLRQLLEPVGVN